MNARRLVCLESSILKGDGGWLTTPPPSRLEARSRLGSQTANEPGAPVVSSTPGQLQGPEPASARMGYEDEDPYAWRYRCIEGPPGCDVVARTALLLGHK